MDTINKFIKKKILIIEDEQPIAHAIDNFLKMDGHDTYLATSGTQGLDLAEKHNPDLILLDIILPEMDGITLLRRIREEDWGKKIPVLVISNLSYKPIEEDAKKLDVYEYLVKSNVSIQSLAEKINGALALKQA
jgi:CheY-like chemotaxis protein